MTRAHRTLVMGCALLAVSWRGAAARDLAREVKAAYLYKFASYVDWPSGAFADATTPVTIGVLGDDDMAEELARTVAGRTSSGRAVTVVRVRPDAPLPPVHILFVGEKEHARMRADLKPVAGKPVLVVTDSDGALAQGSMVNFVLDHDHVRFEVALDATSGAGLTLSSRLLSVARAIKGGRS